MHAATCFLLALWPTLQEDAPDGVPHYGSAPGEWPAGAPLLGEWIPDLEFTDLAGARATLSKAAGANGLVLALRDTDCPVGKKYAPVLKRLEASAAEGGFGLLYLGVQSREDCARDVRENGFGARYAVDADSALARALRATSTTEVFVLDAARTLRYRGMVDDRYGLGFERAEPRRAYLDEALDALRRGDDPAAPATVAHGCLLDAGEPLSLDRPLAYHERIARIVQRRCESCHRAGGLAPFALSSFADVKKRKRMIAYVLGERTMPPWFVDEGSGPWANDPSPSEEERADLIAWCQGDAPEGDPAHAPRPRVWHDGWSIGTPDLVVEMPEAFRVPAEGVVEYQFFDAPLDNPQDLWVQAVEIRPGAREVVHHVIVFVQEPGKPRQTDGIDGFFAGTAPGQGGIRFPEGCAKRIPAGSTLTFQMHYTANGREVLDRSSIGIVLARGRVEREVHTSAAFNDHFSIPPGAFDFPVTGEYRFEEAARILSLIPHTHVRGARFSMELLDVQGNAREVLPLSNYDFNWQHHYDLATPLEVPAGTRLRATAWYDNTADNPANPDPNATVHFGEQTFDEMMIGYFNWIPVDPDAPSNSRAVEASSPRSPSDPGR